MKILINDIAQLLTSEVTTGSEKILTPALQDAATDNLYVIECNSCNVNCLALGNL